MTVEVTLVRPQVLACLMLKQQNRMRAVTVIDILYINDLHLRKIEIGPQHDRMHQLHAG